ncbi:S8 family serine peptidase [Geobacter argillaceus]|uniref:Subtilisin family serine protease n=1 Tax=Geobacter argillaceus TaxID=345631 RepID=A0A562VLE4_9BACT|nr:S8 family serine peptidase [Geobacter argillaceus]TWJ18783.1 subtilisin family serine protease [Geobacter argillaceus]
MKATSRNILSAVLLVGLTLFSTQQSQANTAPAKFVEDELLVQVKPGAPHEKVHRAFADEGASVAGEIPQLNIRQIKIPSHLREKARKNFANNPHFKFVEPNYIADPTIIPNDPSFSSQWHLPKIFAPQGWDTVTGSPSVDIAIADSGVDPTHPDLAGKLIPGYNFYDNNNNTSDVYGHGTKVAGTAAAIGNNGIGVTGVAWGSAIMPLRVSDTAGYGYYSMMANAIVYAADHGVRIVNLSFGGTSSSTTLQSAIDYAWSKGTIVFASAGNSNVSTLTYPAACNHAVAVAATDSSDNKASFSNYGSWITVAAPGSGIYTTANGGGYASVSGTSFSSPITAGVAALILSVNPLLSAQQVVDILKQNTDDLGTPGFDQYFGYGRVNVAKAVAAAKIALVPSDTQPPTVSISSPGNGSIVKGSVAINVAATDNYGVTRVDLFLDGALFASDATSPFAFSWDSTTVADGKHTLQAQAFDAAGNSAASSIFSVTVQNTVDTTPPTITTISPVNGSSVTGLRRVTITTSATDNVAVSKLQLYVDGILKSTVAGSSLSFNWDQRGVAIGSHSITVKAFDTAGNTSSATSVVQR